MRPSVALFIAALAAAILVPPAEARRLHGGFTTSAPAGAVGLVPGVQIDPIIAAGDVVGDFQQTGVPDGMGWWRSSKRTVEVLMDHELADKNQYTNPVNEAGDQFGARVTQMTMNNKGQVLSGKTIIKGTEGFVWFCSGNLAVLNGKPWFFTGEEDVFSTHGGSSVAVDVRHGTYTELPWFGKFGHEQEIPVKGMRKAAFVLSEDGPKSKSQLYQYVSRHWKDALQGSGQLGVFVPDGTATDGDWSSNDISRGQSISGHFEPLDQATDNANAASLEAAAQAKGAFDFVRIEDVAVARNQKGVVYFSDTGSTGHETVRGRIYKLAMDRRDPTKATLTVLLDGDNGDDIVNPDNVDTSKRALVIQEDRNAEHRFSATMGAATGYSRVLVFDLKTGSLRPVARVDTPASIAATRGEGDWETSGMTNARRWFGRGWWLMQVQQHHTTVNQPANPDLVPNTTTGEGGQTVKIYIPGT